MFTAFCVLWRLWSIRWGHPMAPLLLRENHILRSLALEFLYPGLTLIGSIRGFEAHAARFVKVRPVDFRRFT